MYLGMAENGQDGSRTQADVSLPTFPSIPAQQTFIFSIFSSRELCIFYLPQLSPRKEAAAASAGLWFSLSTSHHPTRKVPAAADQPRDSPLHPLPAPPPLGSPGDSQGGLGTQTLTGVVGDGWQALAVLLLDGGCDWAIPEKKRLHGERAEHKQGYTCSTCFPCLQYPLGQDSGWVRSKLIHVLVDVSPQSCPTDTYPFAGWVSQPRATGFIQPGAAGLMLCFPPTDSLLPQIPPSANQTAARHSPCPVVELLVFSNLIKTSRFSIFAS